jgi:hypothetical protein
MYIYMRVCKIMYRYIYIYTLIQITTFISEKHYNTDKVPVALLGPHLVEARDVHPQSAMGNLILSSLD